METKNINIDDLAVSTLKVNGVAAISKANSGHPGIVLGAAKIMHNLFSKHLIFDIENPLWVNRDRFILSAGHGSALLYAQLRSIGLLQEEDLKKFRQIDSKTPGHPEYLHTFGVEATSGPLGQGVATAVGIAVGEAHLSARFPEINHHTYVLLGDGDLQEGVANEAMQFAGTHQLNKLILIHDSNDIQLDTAVANVSKINIEKMVESYGFNYIKATNESFDGAIEIAKKSLKPSFIEVKTIIGEDSPNEGTSKVHGAPLNDEEFKFLKEKLNWTYDDFYLPELVRSHYEKTLHARSKKAYMDFKKSRGLEKFLSIQKTEIVLELPKNKATRETSGLIIDFLNKNDERWIGGSADVASSTKGIGGNGDFFVTNREGKNIRFGVREFAMATIANGLALHSNFKVFVSTYFAFSDYLKPAARLSALMKLPVIYVFTHDSIQVGEDGPTHQPVEQLAMWRSIPNFNVFRPADEKEVLGSYKIALESTETPSALILTRQAIESLKETSSEKIHKGAYSIIHNLSAHWTLVSSGSDLANAYKIAKELNLNLVSIPSFKTKKIFWNVEKSISIESGTTFGWSKFAKYNIGIDSFGASGNADDVMKKFEMDYESLLQKVKKIIK